MPSFTNWAMKLEVCHPFFKCAAVREPGEDQKIYSYKVPRCQPAVFDFVHSFSYISTSCYSTNDHNSIPALLILNAPGVGVSSLKKRRFVLFFKRNWSYKNSVDYCNACSFRSRFSSPFIIDMFWLFGVDVVLTDTRGAVLVEGGGVVFKLASHVTKY